jgi:hypothetical protein
MGVSPPARSSLQASRTGIRFTAQDGESSSSELARAGIRPATSPDDGGRDRLRRRATGRHHSRRPGSSRGGKTAGGSLPAQPQRVPGLRSGRYGPTKPGKLDVDSLWHVFEHIDSQLLPSLSHIEWYCRAAEIVFAPFPEQPVESRTEARPPSRFQSGPLRRQQTRLQIDDVLFSAVTCACLPSSCN